MVRKLPARISARGLTCVLAPLALTGCSAMQMVDFKPPDSNVQPCAQTASPQAAQFRVLSLDVRGNQVAAFHYRLPSRVAADAQDDLELRSALKEVKPSPFEMVLASAENRTASSKGVDTFDKFYRAFSVSARSRMPDAVWRHPAMQAHFTTMVKANAKGMVRLYATSDSDRDARLQEIENYPAPTQLTHNDIKTFAELLHRRFLQPAAMGAAPAQATELSVSTNGTQTPPAKKQVKFGQYFMAYYSGTFVDRFGKTLTSSTQSSSTPKSTQGGNNGGNDGANNGGGGDQAMLMAAGKPNGGQNGAANTSTDTSGQSSTTSLVTDQDIATAMTFLVEYVLDLGDYTPVMGDTSSPKPAVPAVKAQPASDGHPAVAAKAAVPGTTYYPGNNTSQPTALATGMADYEYLSDSPTCGMTRKNALYIAQLSGAASDSATTVTGLLMNSIGGVNGGAGAGLTFAIGGFGKFSLGDSQTLTTVGKAIAARFAMRAYFAHHYWELQGAPQAQAAGIMAVMSTTSGTTTVMPNFHFEKD